MKTYKCVLSLILIFTSMLLFSQQNNKSIGNWSGELDLPTGKLELIFKIAVDESGKLNTKMDVPAQGARDLAVKETYISADSLRLNVAVIMGKFEGKFTSEYTIEGKWLQSGLSLPLTLNKKATVTEIKRPQTPVGPFPYETRDVEYINPVSGFKIAGTLTLPENATDCPAVILISGSGAQDRDETIYEHKPFLVIADYLTRKGVAVLRVDDRGVGGSEGNIAEVTSKDFASDVESGINFLQSVDEINSEQIGLIGHSEGGIIAPMVAANSSDVKFIVLLAGPGVSGDKILIEQTELLNRAAGIPETAINQNLQVTKQLIDVLKTESDQKEAKIKLQGVLSGGMYQMANDDQKKLIDAKINELNNHWFRFFLTYDPYPTLTKIKCPVLALNGAKDLQVPADKNLEAIKNALIEGKNKNYKTMKLDELNHLFQNCKTGSSIEYASLEETFSPKVLDIINNWIWNSALKN